MHDSSFGWGGGGGALPKEKKANCALGKGRQARQRGMEGGGTSPEKKGKARWPSRSAREKKTRGAAGPRFARKGKPAQGWAEKKRGGNGRKRTGVALGGEGGGRENLNTTTKRKYEVTSRKPFLPRRKKRQPHLEQKGSGLRLSRGGTRGICQFSRG